MADATQNDEQTSGLNVATLGGGCFWCQEPICASLRGVVSVTPGYAGGHVANLSVQQVCAGTTGHAEVAQIVVDPKEISFRDPLHIFFATHAVDVRTSTRASGRDGWVTET